MPPREIEGLHQPTVDQAGETDGNIKMGTVGDLEETEILDRMMVVAAGAEIDLERIEGTEASPGIGGLDLWRGEGLTTVPIQAIEISPEEG